MPSIPTPHQPRRHPTAHVDVAHDRSGNPRPGLLVGYAQDGREIARAARIHTPAPIGELAESSWLIVPNDSTGTDDCPIVEGEHAARQALMSLAERAGGAR